MCSEMTYGISSFGSNTQSVCSLGKIFNSLEPLMFHAVVIRIKIVNKHKTVTFSRVQFDVFD